ncbi:His Kinase A (phospho-acceptor) domain-containing protein [Loktanella atrilutea]|uniref:histidine kinase n=1 Tax=Loktanella atrilutea TaxID=366533 RepID=A0A1M4XMF1_LOKAT|nr:hybrid sensor histidine kinase/response regulator [Loktanella atrilutea]SHE94591.1 His Kinase A (phospho-acceptor) domain-containing protein [Loktanella atrilutea]
MTDPVKFLLVDDLSENLLSLEALLRRDDLVLLKARSGDEALELLLDHDVALALIDVQMPGLDGFELAELMRGSERTRRVPIIFVTAGSHSAERRFRGYDAGAVDFIQKPIEPDILRSKAEVFAQIYEQRRTISLQRDQLQAQALALEAADRRKNEFLATLVHELRNPIAALQGGLRLLQRASDPDKAEEIGRLMQNQSSHLLRLVDDLLDVSRISQGKIELRLAPFDLGDAVRMAVAMADGAIAEKSHVLTLDLPDTPLPVTADQVRITQCIINLLINAAKYTDNSGRIGLSVVEEPAVYRVTVTDNGFGLPAHALKSIFDLFEQVDGYRDSAQGGLGIGLALVKQLMQLHGGRVFATSAGTGLGSAFTLEIPRTALLGAASSVRLDQAGPDRVF